MRYHSSMVPCLTTMSGFEGADAPGEYVGQNGCSWKPGFVVSVMKYAECAGIFPRLGRAYCENVMARRRISFGCVLANATRRPAEVRAMLAGDDAMSGAGWAEALMPLIRRRSRCIWNANPLQKCSLESTSVFPRGTVTRISMRADGASGQ